MSLRDIPYREFTCPHCGAPGSMSYGVVEYGCVCRFGTAYSVQQVEPPKCPKCGELFVSIPRMGIGHVCSPAPTDGAK